MHSVSQSVLLSDASIYPIPVWTFSRDVRGFPHFMLWRPYAQQRVGSLTLLNLTVEPKQKALLGSAGRPRTIRLRRSITPNTTSPYWIVSSTPIRPNPRERHGICSRRIPIWAARCEPVGRNGVRNGPRPMASSNHRPHLGLQLRKHALGRRSYSPTALQNYAACPYRFFLQAIHRLAPREVPEAIDELDPLQRGSLIHEIQFELFERLRAANLLPDQQAEFRTRWQYAR